MYRCLIGLYLVGALLAFMYVGFWCTLGGDSNDLWKPFVYGAMWPVIMPFYLMGCID